MKKVLALVLALAMVAVMFVACTKKEETPASSKVEPSKSEPAKSEPAKSETPASSTPAKKYDKWSLACVYSEITGDFWGVVYNGCIAALDELKAQYGIEGYCIAPATASDYTQQMDLLDTVLLEKPNGLVLCPSNADSIGTYVTDKFTDDSIPIIVIDRSMNSTSPAVVGSYTSDAYAMSVGQYEMAERATKDLDKVTYIAVGLSPDNQQWADRSYGFMDKAKDNPKYTSYTGDTPYWGSQVTQDQLIQYLQDTINSNPDLNFLLLGVCNSHNNYIITAISELSKEKQEKCTVLGWDFSATEKGYMESGVMYGAMGQNPYLMGYDSTYLMCDYLAGDKNAAKGKSVPFQAVDIENINSDEVKAYMKTMGML